MTCLSIDPANATLTSPRPRRPRLRMRSAAASVARAGAVLLALSSLAVPDAVMHAKWFKLGLILETASRHYAARS